MIRESDTTDSLAKGVSVPLRGKYCRESQKQKFNLLITKFPSPCGVNIVGNYKSDAQRLCHGWGVSVPLRGKYCRESLSAADVANELWVSVPLRGKYCRES